MMVLSAFSKGDTDVIVGAMQNVTVVPLLFGLALRNFVIAFSRIAVTARKRLFPVLGSVPSY